MRAPESARGVPRGRNSSETRRTRYSEWSDLREVLGLLRVPHYSTLCYAERRLLKGGSLPPSWAASSSVPVSLS